ncbi:MULTISPECIES: prephenate dehydrogenase [unclassified Streptomyces]|uniref:prephenate dehydrogenase n=1 Tax=unclassified Streptomyces TaxID=2593676 RepID=UPI0027D9E7E9|nr:MULTISPECIES: prephenate dehydrogenase [unclassified Streptomyces]
MLRTAVVVGTGMIGTSVALALRARGVTTYLVDRVPEVARTAEAIGAGIAQLPRERVELAVLAVPPSGTADALAEWQGRDLAESYTDVASVKGGPHREMTAAGCDLTRFVGGHPMAGSERSGPAAARGDLFRDRPWVLTPSRHSGDAALGRTQQLVQLCGARPLLMDHAEHDRAVALVSHTPHLVSSLLAARLTDAGADQLQLAGRGLRDTTRIAAGDVELWTDILGSNAEAVHTVLSDLTADLGEVLAALDRLGLDGTAGEEAVATLRSALARGIEGRERLDPPAPHTAAAETDGTDGRPHDDDHVPDPPVLSVPALRR